MNRLVQYLNEKNHFLEKFYSLNEAQIKKLEAGFFDELEVFYNQRERLLKILKYIDAEILKAHKINKSEATEYSDGQKTEIHEYLRTKEAYAKRILEQDLQILGLIDDAKSAIIKELQEIQKTRKALAGYKSGAA